MSSAPEPTPPSASTPPVPATPATPATPAAADAPDNAQQDNTGSADSAGNAPVRRGGHGVTATAGAVAGAALNFVTLTARVAALTTSALYLKERMHSLMTHTERNADKVQAVSEMCDAAGVETQYTALVMTSATALRTVVGAARDVKETADRAELHARMLGDAHQREYRGTYEAVQASGVQQPKAGFNAVR